MVGGSRRDGHGQAAPGARSPLAAGRVQSWGGGHSLAPEAPLACRQQQLDLPPLSLLFPTLNKPTNVLPSRGSWAGVA